MFSCVGRNMEYCIFKPVKYNIPYYFFGTQVILVKNTTYKL